MFIVQGISQVFHDAEIIEQGELHYDSLLHNTPGMYWNVYLQGINDPSRTIHTQGWAAQSTSEGFGVSPAFQAHRQRLPASTGAPRSSMTGPLSPGYWTPVVDVTYQLPPTGHRTGNLGVVRHGLLFVRPGQEQAYVEAEQAIAEALRSADGILSFRSFRNLGQPNAYTRLIHWRDAAAEAAFDLSALEPRRQAIVEQETADLYDVKLYSDWPDRRLADGV